MQVHSYTYIMFQQKDNIYTPVASGVTGYWDTKLAVGVGVQPIITQAQLAAASGTSISMYFDDFSIIESTTTATSTIASSKGEVFVANKTLHVNGTTAKFYQVLNITGAVVEKGLIDGDTFSKALNLPAGIYIVKAGTKTVKVTL